MINANNLIDNFEKYFLYLDNSTVDAFIYEFEKKHKNKPFVFGEKLKLVGDEDWHAYCRTVRDLAKLPRNSGTPAEFFDHYNINEPLEKIFL